MSHATSSRNVGSSTNDVDTFAADVDTVLSKVHTFPYVIYHVRKAQVRAVLQNSLFSEYFRKNLEFRLICWYIAMGTGNQTIQELLRPFIDKDTLGVRPRERSRQSTSGGGNGEQDSSEAKGSGSKKKRKKSRIVRDSDSDEDNVVRVHGVGSSTNDVDTFAADVDTVFSEAREFPYHIVCENQVEMKRALQNDAFVEYFRTNAGFKLMCWFVALGTKSRDVQEILRPNISEYILEKYPPESSRQSMSGGGDVVAGGGGGNVVAGGGGGDVVAGGGGSKVVAGGGGSKVVAGGGGGDVVAGGGGGNVVAGGGGSKVVEGGGGSKVVAGGGGSNVVAGGGGGNVVAGGGGGNVVEGGGGGKVVADYEKLIFAGCGLDVVGSDGKRLINTIGHIEFERVMSKGVVESTWNVVGEPISSWEEYKEFPYVRYRGDGYFKLLNEDEGAAFLKSLQKFHELTLKDPVEIVNELRPEEYLNNRQFRNYIFENKPIRRKMKTAAKAKGDLNLVAKLTFPNKRRPWTNHGFEIKKCMEGWLQESLANGDELKVGHLMNNTDIRGYLHLNYALQLRCWLLARNKKASRYVTDRIGDHIHGVIQIHLFPYVPILNPEPSVIPGTDYPRDLEHMREMLNWFEGELIGGDHEMVYIHLSNQYFLRLLLSRKSLLAYYERLVSRLYSRENRFLINFLTKLYVRDDPDYERAYNAGPHAVLEYLGNSETWRSGDYGKMWDYPF